MQQPEDIQPIFLRCLKAVAPEVDPATLQPESRFREQFAFDSVNLLDLAQELEQALGLRIPEQDYLQLITLKGAIAYLSERLQANRRA